MTNDDIIKALQEMLKHYKQNTTPDAAMKYCRVGNVAIKIAEIRELKLI